jgi:hypothetical protein
MVEIDERYKQGMIYTIRNIKDDKMIYVGSTINNLSKRFYNHKEACKRGKGVSLYSYIENNDWTDYYIELYEAYPCNNKKELNRREGEVIREIGTINKCIAGRTKKEWTEDNADKIKEKIKKWREENADKEKERYKKYCQDNIDKEKERHKKYYKDNIDKINEKVCCNICGAFSSKQNLLRHQKSKSCMSKSFK